ncbi:hypothetical protein J6590_064033 [Homalodisca vitripennis]|nr:hypothetical protein J6590_064033 [Homalodisca vitripennis]
MVHEIGGGAQLSQTTVMKCRCQGCRVSTGLKPTRPRLPVSRLLRFPMGYICSVCSARLRMAQTCLLIPLDRQAILKRSGDCRVLQLPTNLKRQLEDISPSPREVVSPEHHHKRVPWARHTRSQVEKARESSRRGSRGPCLPENIHFSTHNGAYKE